MKFKLITNKYEIRKIKILLISLVIIEIIIFGIIFILYKSRIELEHIKFHELYR